MVSQQIFNRDNYGRVNLVRFGLSRIEQIGKPELCSKSQLKHRGPNTIVKSQPFSGLISKLLSIRAREAEHWCEDHLTK